MKRLSSPFMNASGQTICLSMIVKDEAHVIARALASVRPILDHWIVVDTGSTDGTIAAVEAALAGLPGEIVRRPWVDFGTNRTQALELARPHAAYSLIIDADDELLLPFDFRMPDLVADSYEIEIKDATLTYRRLQMVANRLPWRYVGVLHEFLSCPGAGTVGTLPAGMRRNHDGRRRLDSGTTYTRDAAILARALEVETDPMLRARYTYYLAQSYRDCGSKEQALAAFLARESLGFWNEEIFVALVQAGRLMEALGHDPETILATYARATALCPARAEAAHGASRLCRNLGRHAQGRELARPALGLPPPPGGLFVESWIYEYGLRDEFAVNAYWSGDYRGCADAALAALEQTSLPEGDRARILKNLRFAFDRLAEPIEESAASARPASSEGWAPSRPLGGTELMVEGLRERIGAALDSIDLRVNLYDPKTRDSRPLVVWFHHDVDQAAVQWCRDTALIAPIARFVFISYWQRERYVAQFGLPPERCVVIKYAMDQSSDPRRWEPAPIVRCAYTSTPFRGLDVLLDAWARLPEGVAELHVWSSMKLYTADDAPYRPLFERARSMPGVHYHGLAPNEELRAALRTMHFLTYPSTFAETACLSVMEAMAAGVRIIVPSFGVLPETTGGYARVYPWCADKAAHAAAFHEVLEDEIADPWQGRPELALAQQSHCATVFAWSRALAEWRALIRALRPDLVAPVVSSKRDAPARAIGSAGSSATLPQALRRLRDHGFAPSGIIDVGAHDGSFARAARQAFPDARILMVDALVEKDAILAGVAKRIGDADHVIALLGDRREEATPFFVVDTNLRPDLVTTGASAFRENTDFPMEERRVAQHTLGELLAERSGRFELLKLDVQGAELAIVEGMGAALADVEVVILEMSLVAYNEGAPLAAEVIARLAAKGFLLHDLLEENRHFDQRLLQIDGIFVREESRLRPRKPFWTR